MPVDKFIKLERMRNVSPAEPLPNIPKLDPDFLLGTPEERRASIEKFNADWELFFRENRQIAPSV